jgi:hypothetical protein
MRGFSRCAEEDSNLHPVIPDQALNLVTQLSDTSYASISSRTSTNLDVMGVMDDLDVATDVATAANRDVLAHRPHVSYGVTRSQEVETALTPF